MGLTILAIPLIMLGVFIKPYTQENTRCFNLVGKVYCFEQSSQMPEIVKYGSVVLGFALLYAGDDRSSGSAGEARFVMPGLVPGIHVLLSTLRQIKAWTGTSPAMTRQEVAEQQD